jgi:hypothetical protein
MKLLVFKGWLYLLFIDFVMHCSKFAALERIVRNAAIHSGLGINSVESIVHAVDLACVFYFKRVLCLQRSVATTLLLRRSGWAAELVIGTRILPFASHAWTEIQGNVVNDKPYILEIFQVLHRC